MWKALLESMRPRQWLKNVFVFGALVFDGQLFILTPALRTLAGFALFCLISSAVYLFNDLADIEADRRHPTKRNRPLASGRLPVPAAWAAGLILLAISVAGGFLLAVPFGLVLSGYFILMAAYSNWLKHIAILDVMVIAIGFVLRVHAGVTLIQVQLFSPWLYVVTTLLALYLGFGKRRAELALLADEAGAHRKVLDGYTVALLDQYIQIVSGATIVAYSLYTFSSPTLPGNHSMMLTIPFVLYGIFRYLYLVEVKHHGGAPEDILYTDRPLQLAILLFALTVLAVFYLR